MFSTPSFHFALFIIFLNEARLIFTAIRSPFPIIFIRFLPPSLPATNKFLALFLPSFTASFKSTTSSSMLASSTTSFFHLLILPKTCLSFFGTVGMGTTNVDGSLRYFKATSSSRFPINSVNSFLGILILNKRITRRISSIEFLHN